MKAAIDIGTLVVQTPGTCGGRPRIAGTRVTIQNIAIDFNAGMQPEEIIAERTHLTQAQVYAALAYYFANKEAINADITDYYADITDYYKEFDRLETEYQSGQGT
jgi:uncharacterized protein (DUF433 family)